MMKIFNRRLDITLLCSLLSTALVQSAYAECENPVPAFVEKITQQVIMVGEIQGTEEIPAFAGDLLCYYAKKKTPVLIGFAMPLNSQASINAYVASKGDKADKDALFSDPFWRESARFGLASKAIWEVLELARSLKSQGYLVVPFAYDQQRLQYDAMSPPAKIGKPLSPNAQIGWNLVSRGLAYPEYKIIVLSGNANADRDAGHENAIAIVEKFIPVFSIGFVHQGGTASNCVGPSPQKIVCGIHAVRPSSDFIQKGFNDLVNLGELHAAPPAVDPAIDPASAPFFTP